MKKILIIIFVTALVSALFYFGYKTFFQKVPMSQTNPNSGGNNLTPTQANIASQALNSTQQIDASILGAFGLM